MDKACRFSLTTNSCEELRNKAFQLVQSGKKPEFELRTEDGIVKIHRDLASLASKVLRNQIEKLEALKQDLIFSTSKSLSFKILTKLVQWIYGQTVTAAGVQEITEFLKAGSMLEITGFSQDDLKAGDEIINQLSFEPKVEEDASGKNLNSIRV